MENLFRMVKGYLLIIVLAFSQLLFSQGSSESIDLYLKNKMTELKIPGLQLAIIRNGKVEKLSNYGFANLEHKVETKTNSVFSINSMTKAFVGVAIMQL